MRDASAASCAMKTSARVSHHESAGDIRRSARSGFNGLLRALPGDRTLVCHRRLLLRFPLPVGGGSPGQLDATFRASGPLDLGRPRQHRRQRFIGPDHDAP